MADIRGRRTAVLAINSALQVELIKPVEARFRSPATEKADR